MSPVDHAYWLGLATGAPLGALAMLSVLLLLLRRRARLPDMGGAAPSPAQPRSVSSVARPALPGSAARRLRVVR